MDDWFQSLSKEGREKFFTASIITVKTRDGSFTIKDRWRAPQRSTEWVTELIRRGADFTVDFYTGFKDPRKVN